MQFLRLLPLYLIASTSLAADLTGNWVVAQPLNDGTTRRTYFNLQQDGEKITGAIRYGPVFLSCRRKQGGERRLRHHRIHDGRHSGAEGAI